MANQNRVAPGWGKDFAHPHSFYSSPSKIMLEIFWFLKLRDSLWNMQYMTVQVVGLAIKSLFSLANKTSHMQYNCIVYNLIFT